jgi:hypothetical protein
MSATAVLPAPRLRNDLAAGGRHFLTRLRMTARDPFALGLLAFAGAVTVPLWGFGLGVHPSEARHLPWPGGVVWFGRSTATALHLAVRFAHPAVVFSQLLGAALVAGALGPASARRRWPPARERAMPALPLGPRVRVAVDVLVAALWVVIARAFVLWLGGVRLGRMLFGPDPSLAMYPELTRLVTTLLPTGSPPSPTLAYASSFVMSTILGTLLSFPLVLAWATTTRLNARGLVKLAVATLLVFGAASVGAMAHFASAVIVSAGVSAFLLVRLDDGSRAESVRPARPLRFRASLGPVAQLRRDAWLGPARRLWWVLLLAVALPLTLTFMAATAFDPLGGVLGLKDLAFLAALLLQWPTLLALALFPFGLALVPPATPATGLFRGAFLRSWRTLPVAPERVVRSVYAHGLLAAGFAWLMLCLQARLLGLRLGSGGHGRLGLLYELPAVFLMAGIAVCEAVGDRRRGLLAVGALATFQFRPALRLRAPAGGAGQRRPIREERPAARHRRLRGGACRCPAAARAPPRTRGRALTPGLSSAASASWPSRRRTPSGMGRTVTPASAARPSPPTSAATQGCLSHHRRGHSALEGDRGLPQLH